MDLIDRRMVAPEPNLIRRYQVLASTIGFNRLKNNFSKNSEIIGSNEIGLYEETSLGGFPGFGIIITLAMKKLHWEVFLVSGS